MTKEEKIDYAVRLLQEADVDFRVGRVRFENIKASNPALEYSAKQFNDALLDEQAKKIDAYKKQFTHLADVLHKKNVKIEELEKKVNVYANKLADACVELRELKEKLANIVVNNVNAQALKSAESALVYKDKVISEKDEVIDDISKELLSCKEKEGRLIASIKGYQKELRKKQKKESSYVDELKKAGMEAFKKRVEEIANHAIVSDGKGNGILDF